MITYWIPTLSSYFIGTYYRLYHIKYRQKYPKLSYSSEYITPYYYLYLIFYTFWVVFDCYSWTVKPISFHFTSFVIKSCQTVSDFVRSTSLFTWFYCPGPKGLFSFRTPHYTKRPKLYLFCSHDQPNSLGIVFPWFPRLYLSSDTSEFIILNFRSFSSKDGSNILLRTNVHVAGSLYITTDLMRAQYF